MLNDHMYSARNISGSNWCLYENAGGDVRLDLIPDGFQGDIALDRRDRISSVDDC